ncbi:MAG: winged helix-turn-helix transcriptional regulator [Chloroflexota bacterium]|nr:winged helix-turn-helix transcriptional regulator [Chloroflexota bacterium]
MPQWSFLTNHALVLSFIAQHPSITARELAQAVGITERAVRRIVQDLETDGYVAKRRVGRGLRYRVNPDLSLRHEAHWDKAVGDLLELLGWKKRATRVQRKASSRPVGTHNVVTPQQ